MGQIKTGIIMYLSVTGLFSFYKPLRIFYLF